MNTTTYTPEGEIIKNYCLECRGVATSGCETSGHTIGTLGRSKIENSPIIGKRLQIAKRHPLDFTIAQLAAIRKACLEVIDDQHWDMWETKRIEPGEVKVSISEDQANEARLDFCDAVQRTLKDMVWEQKNAAVDREE